MKKEKALLFSFLMMALPLFACTGIRLGIKDGSYVNGRTVEFGVPLTLGGVVIPRGYAFRGTTPLGKGISYEAKYAAVGAIVFGIPAIMDGVNEKGLSVGAFYFPGFAGYTKTNRENLSKSLSPIEFTNWIVTQFATVEEVKAGLLEVVIAPTVANAWGNTPPPFHYVVYDKMGGSLVIEPVDGKLVVHENPIGVITNSPTFDWHMTNLRNFINLKTTAAPSTEMQGVELSAFGMGSGMVGLPGDFTPPSRFVRAAIFSSAAPLASSFEEGVFQVFHLLNLFDIPLGSACRRAAGAIDCDSTLATCVKDPQNLKYYFKTYEDQSVQFIDLNQFDWNAKAIQAFSFQGKQKVGDVSSQFKEGKVSTRRGSQ